MGHVARMAKQVLLFSVVVGLMGCNEQYESERALYKATRLSENVLVNPDVIPPKEFNQAVDAYKHVVRKYPYTLSAKKATGVLGSLYLAKKEFEKAREELKRVLELYPGNGDMCIEARYNIGKSYENEGLWYKALLEYQGIMEEFPDSEIGLDLPLYIAQHYNTRQADEVKKDLAFKRAIAHYIKLAERHKDTPVGFKAENFIARCYLEKEDWDEAIVSLERLVMDYPGAVNVGLSMRMIANICVKELDTPDRAEGIFEEFLARYPKHPLIETLNKGLEAVSNVSLGKKL